MAVLKGCRKRPSVWQTAACLILLIAVAGCAPKVRVVPDEVVQQSAASLAKREGFQEGFRVGESAGKKKSFDRCLAKMEELRDYLLYYVMREKGAVLPARVQRVFVEGGTSRDGRVFTPPHIEFVIVQPAQFNTEQLSRLLKSSLYSWIVLSRHADRVSAYEEMSRVRKFTPGDYLEVVPAKSGGFVLMVRVRRDLEQRALAFYRQNYSSALLVSER